MFLGNKYTLVIKDAAATQIFSRNSRSMNKTFHYLESIYSHVFIKTNALTHTKVHYMR